VDIIPPRHIFLIRWSLVDKKNITNIPGLFIRKLVNNARTYISIVS